MGTFLGNMIYVLEALGFAFFEQPGAPLTETPALPPMSMLTPAVHSFFTGALPRSETHKAHLDMVGDGYVLRAGSIVSATATDSLPSSVAKLRAQLLSKNALVLQDGCLRLTKDIAFTSPSPASALVKGRSSTGHGECIRTTDRKKLGDVLRER